MTGALAPVHDLGARDGPLLLFGGPYGNRQATEALLAEAARQGIAGDSLICTGDTAAYGADPQPVCDLLRGAGVATVMGNCEESLGFDRADCGCGFDDGSACDVMSARWFAYCREQLDADTKAWMRGLPRRLSLTLSGRHIAVVHGASDSINGYVFASSPASERTRQRAALGADLVVGGHAGLPFLAEDGDGLWLNAGAIGLPANDGTPRVWYALLTPHGDHVRVAIKPLDYDHEAAAARMRAAALPEGYAAALETGLWPNTDILPDAETQARGQALPPVTMDWRRGAA